MVKRQKILNSKAKLKIKIIKRIKLLVDQDSKLFEQSNRFSVKLFSGKTIKKGKLSKKQIFAKRVKIDTEIKKLQKQAKLNDITLPVLFF